MKRRLPLVLLLSSQLVVGALGQQPAPSPTPPPTQQQPESDDVVRINTNLVQVDAVITDKNGKIVTDLKPEELEILEDDRQQKITHFSYNVTQNQAAPSDTTSAPANKPAGPMPP